MEHAVVPGMTREQKLSEWIEQYSDPILRTCYLYLSDMQMAEDALQETWIKADKHMQGLPADSLVPSCGPAERAGGPASALCCRRTG